MFIYLLITGFNVSFRGPRWQSGNTLASHLWGRGSIPGTASSGKAGSCLPLVGSLQYRTLTNCMYWFPLPFQLPVVIWPVQCWKQRKTQNKQITSLSTHCKGHITMGSFVGRRKPVHTVWCVKVLYCKLPTNAKQLPAFPLLSRVGIRTLISETGRWEC